MGACCCCCGNKKEIKAQFPPPKPKLPPVLKPESPKREPEPPAPEPKPEPVPEPPKKIEVDLMEETKLIQKPVEVQVEQVEPPPEPTQADLDDDYFTKKIEEQKNDFQYQQAEKAKWSIKEYLSQEQILQEQGENDVCGPIVRNNRLPSVENKYDFSKLQGFAEFKEKIILVKLIEKPENSTCTFVGKIQGLLCCVKLIPMIKDSAIQQWIVKVNEAQTSKDLFIGSYFQKYYYYQKQFLDQDKSICNLFIITALEQYNAYTFSLDSSITLREKARAAYDIIQVVSKVLTEKTKNHLDNSTDTKIKDFYKNITTIKRNNLLISKRNNQIQVKLADWQLLLGEFQQVISEKSIQMADNNQTLVEEFLSLTTLQQKTQYNRQRLTETQKQEIEQQQDAQNASLLVSVEKYTKHVLNLIFFRVNYDMLKDFALEGFIDGEVYEKIEKKVNQKEIQNQSVIFKEFQLPSSHNVPQLLDLYKILQMPSCEGMRPELDKLFQFSQIE